MFSPKKEWDSLQVRGEYLFYHGEEVVMSGEKERMTVTNRLWSSSITVTVPVIKIVLFSLQFS